MGVFFFFRIVVVSLLFGLGSGRTWLVSLLLFSLVVMVVEEDIEDPSC